MIDILEALKKDLGSGFVDPLQEAVILQVVNGGDALLVMSPGAERAVCFQMSAMILAGTAVVISERESWMLEQVEMLCSNRVAAGMPSRSMAIAERVALRDQCVEGELKLLYLTPDRLRRVLPWLKERVEVSLFVIDEAQRMLDCGRRLRPEYVELKSFREQFPGVPVLALAATTDELVKEALVMLLRLQEGQVFVGKVYPEAPVFMERVSQESYMCKQKRLHRNAYSKWTGADDRALQASYLAGASVRELAAAFNRNEGAIRSRLKKLGGGSECSMPR